MKDPILTYNRERDEFQCGGLSCLSGHAVENLARHREQLLSEGRTKPSILDFFPLSTANLKPQGQTLVRDMLGGIAVRPKISGQTQIINGATGGAAVRVEADANKPWFTIRNNASADAAEVLIYDQIGKDWWSGEGVGAKDYREALAKLDSTKNRPLNVRINSPGGNVFDGLAIRSIHKDWKGKVNTYNDGLAASIASVILLSPANGGKVYASKESSTMIHRASTVAMGTVEDMQRAISALESAEKNILSVYVERTGKTEQELSDAMAKETWMTGPEAKDFGFVDEVTESVPVTNSFDLSSFKRVPEAFRKLQNSAAQGGGHSSIMNRQQIIARLKKLGITVDDKSTDEQLIAQLDAAIDAAQKPQTPAPTPTPAAAVPAPSAPDAATTNRIAQLEAKYEAERKQRVTNAVNAYVNERRIMAGQAAKWIERCMTDESVLADLQAMQPQMPPEGISVECVSEDIGDVSNHVRRLGKEISADALEGRISASHKAIERAKMIRKNQAKFQGIWNAGTNTIDSTLKQDVLMDIGLRAFARILTPLSAFSTMFSNVPLRGTDIVTVPFLDLEAAASTDFVGATGYVAGDTTRDKRQVTINKRKYQGLSFTSSELARQPFLMVSETFALKGEKLAYDVWSDILSVVTVANFAQATKADASVVSPAPVGAWDANRIADLQQVASELNWPIPGRQFFTNAALDNQLKKDSSLKLALNFGGTEVMRDGTIPNIYGFNYITNPNLPSNSISLVGFIAWKTAILIASSPIPPTEEVVRDGTQYSMAVDPDTGIAVEYRSFGDSQKDNSLRFIECNYGYAKGNASALRTITSA